METHYRKLERMYVSANINKEIFHPTIKVSSGAAEISILVTEKLFHAAGALHGAVSFKMLDDACFFSAQSAVEDVFVLTTKFTIEFFRPNTGGVIKSVGKFLGEKNGIFYSEALVFNDQGKEIAAGKGEFRRSKIKLAETPGYQ